MADVHVRSAGAADVARIAEIQVVTWRAAYGELLPPAALDELTVESARGAWDAAVSEPPTPLHRVLVAHEGADIVGFASLEPSQPDPGESAQAHAGEIGILLVEPRWGRRGHGSRLLAAACDTLASLGMRTVSTWVLEQDEVTAPFLESAGWAADGTVRVLDAAGSPLRQIRLHARLEENT